MKIVLSFLVSLLLVVSALAGCAPKKEAPAAVTEYNIVGLLDYTAAYSYGGPACEGAARIVFGWWNETKGKKIGVRLEFKSYDHKQNPATCTTLYNAAKITDKPLVVLVQGGGQVIAMSQLVKEDQIPCISLYSAYGFSARPNGWVVTPASTYPHHLAAVTDYWLEQWREPRKMRVAGVFVSSPAGNDLIQGAENYIKMRADKLDWVITEWLPQGTTEPLANIKRIEAKDPDVLWSGSDLPGGASVITALNQLGMLKKIRLLNAVTNDLAQLTQLLPRDVLEGLWDTNVYNYLDTESEAAKIFIANKPKYAPKCEDWGVYIGQVICPVLLTCDAIERAAKTVGGGDKITPVAVFNELNAGTFDGHGITKQIQFDPEDRLAGASWAIGHQMQKGKVVAATPWVKIPKIPPWGPWVK